MNISNYRENRREERILANELSCVELRIPIMQIGYKFRIRDISNSGMCIMVNENSELLNYIKKGDIYEMKYYPENNDPCNMKTEIRHISKQNNGKFKGHILVGLLIVE